MNILQIAKDYVPLLNALVLLLISLKFVVDARRQRLEQERLARELKELRERETEAASRLLRLTSDEVNRMVVSPLIESMRKRDQELQDGHRRLLETFFQAANSIREKTVQRDKELQDSQRLVLEAFYHAAETIRQNINKATVGSKLAALIEENSRALRELRQCVSPVMQERDTPPSVPSG